MIIEVLTRSSFIDAFNQSTRKDQFSYEALKELYNYYDQLSNDIDEAFELDIIAICCDMNEQPLQDALNYYNLESFEELKQNTWAVMINDKNVLYQQY